MFPFLMTKFSLDINNQFYSAFKKCTMLSAVLHAYIVDKKYPNNDYYFNDYS